MRSEALLVKPMSSTFQQRMKSVGLENNEGHKNKGDFFHIENVMAAQQATKENIVLRSTRLERAGLMIWDA